MDDIFDELDGTEEMGYTGDLCPSCGNIPAVSGATVGCNDPEGCGVYADSEEDPEEDDEEYVVTDWDDDDDDEEEEEEELEELDFGS